MTGRESNENAASRCLVLVHKAHKTLLAWQAPNVGRLLSPRQYARVAATATADIPWAADNDCFQGLDEKAYRRMLAAIRGVPGCLFVVAPDSVGDAAATWDLFWEWWPRLNDVGQPVAFALQDGCTPASVPWDLIGAVFVGGSTEFKCSDEAHDLVREAQRRGLWAHMGRVNTAQRMMLARSWGCDSVDGTSVSMFTNRRLPERLAQARAPRQLNLREIA